MVTRPVALVTGAARRVGRAIALELARAGFDLAVHYRTSASEAAEVVAEVAALGAGARAEALAADLDRSGDIRRLFADLDAAFGRLDVLVNSAAVFRHTPPGTLSEDDFDFHVTTNLKAPYLCSIEAAQRMREGGLIVNVADVAAERPFRGYVPYCVSKAGVVMLTRSMAKAYAPGIRVNAVAPGTVLFRDDEDDEVRRDVVRRIPLGRVGTPEDVARTVRFLWESPHITGAVIPVDGGRSLD